MSATIQKTLPTIAVILFFASSLCAALWDIEVDGRRFLEDYASMLMQPGNGEPGRLFEDNLHCPRKVSHGEPSTIVVTITNPGASADYEVTLWDEEMYESRYSVPAGMTLCSTRVHIRGRDTVEVACDVHAPQKDSLWRIVAWAASSEDTAPTYTSRRSNSYFGICQIHVGSYSTDYLSSPLGIISLSGVIMSAALWLLTRTRERRLVNLRTGMSALIGILVWIPPFWYDILHLEAEAPVWLGDAPILACIMWLVLFFANMLRH